jgi:hypothetical protein
MQISPQVIAPHQHYGGILGRFKKFYTNAGTGDNHLR